MLNFARPLLEENADRMLYSVRIARKGSAMEMAFRS